MALKQSLQYTGLSPRGRKGTWVSMPHWAQTAGCISRWPPPYPPPPPPPPYPPCWLRRAPRQAGQRLGSLVKPLEAKNSCSPTVKTKTAPQSLHVRSLSEIAIRMASIYVDFGPVEVILCNRNLNLHHRRFYQINPLRHRCLRGNCTGNVAQDGAAEPPEATLEPEPL